MSSSKRRKIVVEGISCQWQVTSDQVHVWHPTLGRKAWKRDFSDAWDDWEASGTPVTPRDVADFIYREFLGREPPPRPVVTAIYPRPERMLVPKPNPTQPEVYLLVKVMHWFDEEDRYMRTSDEIVAAFTDPMMAKIQAERLNPAYADLVRELGRWTSWQGFHNKLGPQAEHLAEKGFALWKAVSLTLYGSREIERWAA